MESQLDQDILQQIRTILRRDLKLSKDEALPEEMALFGGNIDLDSLDMLLMLTSIEKQFGIRIPSQEVGKEAFRNVGTLARYVQENRVDVRAVDWISRLPHGPEFRFISRVIEVRQGEMARAVWTLTGKEPFFAAHFPGNPIVPGVLMVEAMAQVCGLAGPESSAGGMLVNIDVRFEQAVAPPTDIELTAKLIRVMGAMQMFDVTAQVGGTMAARGTIALHRAGDVKPQAK